MSSQPSKNISGIEEEADVQCPGQRPAGGGGAAGAHDRVRLGVNHDGANGLLG